MGKKKDKKKKDKKKPSAVRRSPNEVKNALVLQQTKSCKVEVVNNDLPWEREVLSSASRFKFSIKEGKIFSVSFDEKNKSLSITCEDAPCNIQPMSPNHFLIR